MTKNAKSSSSKDDLAWSELDNLATLTPVYHLLCCVEAFYWFLTQPSDTLAPLQVTEAWLGTRLPISFTAMANMLHQPCRLTTDGKLN